MVTINRCIKALLHPAGGHQGSHKAHQAGNQSKRWCLYIDTASCVHVLCAITQKFCFSISKVYSNLLNYMANGAAIDADYDCKPIALSLYLTVLFLLWVNYHKISNFNRTNPKNQNDSRLVFAQSIEARWKVENEDVVGSAPTGDAPTTSEWSTILLPTKVWLVLEV